MPKVSSTCSFQYLASATSGKGISCHPASFCVISTSVHVIQFPNCNINIRGTQVTAVCHSGHIGNSCFRAHRHLVASETASARCVRTASGVVPERTEHHLNPAPIINQQHRHAVADFILKLVHDPCRLLAGCTPTGQVITIHTVGDRANHRSRSSHRLRSVSD